MFEWERTNERDREQNGRNITYTYKHACKLTYHIQIHAVIMICEGTKQFSLSISLPTTMSLAISGFVFFSLPHGHMSGYAQIHITYTHTYVNTERGRKREGIQTLTHSHISTYKQPKMRVEHYICKPGKKTLNASRLITDSVEKMRSEIRKCFFKKSGAHIYVEQCVCVCLSLSMDKKNIHTLIKNLPSSLYPRLKFEQQQTKKMTMYDFFPPRHRHSCCCCCCCYNHCC